MRKVTSLWFGVSHEKEDEVTLFTGPTGQKSSETDNAANKGDITGLWDVSKHFLSPLLQ